MLVGRDAALLVERERETARLSEALAECTAGRGSVATIGGPVGSGKTALLRAFADRAAESGFTHLSATASRAERAAAMGVLGQIFGDAPLADDVAGKVTSQLDDAALAAMMRNRDDGPAGEVDMEVRRDLAGALMELSERTPLLVTVDDAHFADAESMQCLLYLIRRIERARVLVVLTGAAGMRPSWPQLIAEVVSQPNYRQLRVGPLSPAGVADLLACRIDVDGAEAELWHRLSGGSPLLLNALVEDHLAASAATDAAPSPVDVAGTAFKQAVQTCLYRGDDSMLPVAQALAVLGEPASASLLGEVLGEACPSAACGLETATAAGLVDAGMFRHPQAAAAVLDAMSASDRAALHARAAQVLYRNGAGAIVVARHVLAAGRVDAPWSVPVLREAAEQAMEQDDTGFAFNCLHLAERRRVSVAERAAIHAGLLRVRWRLDPTSAERYARELMSVARAGRLRSSYALLLIKHLMWFGRPAEVIELLDRTAEVAAEEGPESVLAFACARASFGYFYPGVDTGQTEATPVPPAASLIDATDKLRARTTSIVEAIHRDGVTEEAIAAARAILQQHRLDDHTWDSLVISLATLVLADCLGDAAIWCDGLLREAEEREVPAWRAILSAVRATISLRQGNFPDAERHAQAAVTLVPAKALGVFAGAPISVLVLAATRQRRYGEVLRLLAMPVPEAMFQTPFGLIYLRARGRFHLARGNYESAIEDFEACGELMVRWGLDLPGLAPWRTDLDEARRKRGIPARQLAAEQLAKLGPYNRRTRGISLRALAATAEPNQRVRLLREAVDELQAAGDHLGLVEALMELGEAQHAVGAYAEARLTARRAQQLATRYGLEDVIAARPAANGYGAVVDDPVIEELSDAERRVASLAVQGRTNQQIARELFITVSTVEQHLTKVYRKLRITRRSDLPFSLLDGLCNTA